MTLGTIGLAEVYRKGDRVVGVHRREDGVVYFHTQDADAPVCYLGINWYQMAEAVFDAQVQAEGGERLSEWPAA